VARRWSRSSTRPRRRRFGASRSIELVAELINARREVGLSTTVGDKELAAAAEALAALNTARASLVKTHKAGPGRRALHIPVKRAASRPSRKTTRKTAHPARRLLVLRFAILRRCCNRAPAPWARLCIYGHQTPGPRGRRGLHAGGWGLALIKGDTPNGWGRRLHRVVLLTD